MDPYRHDPHSNHWYHYVAAVKSFDRKQYGVQATRFFCGGQWFIHCALTDVSTMQHHRLEVYGPQSQKAAVIHRLGLTPRHHVIFDVDGIEVRLQLLEPGKPEVYPSQTSYHYGFPRMEVDGTIGGMPVSGVGCFDREIFKKLLLPGDYGWIWTVIWLSSGETRIVYRVLNNKGNRRFRLMYGPDMLVEVKEVMRQRWPRNSRRAFAYDEGLVNVFGGLDLLENVGVGYQEHVGFDGVPVL